jgi:tight adherence protein C
VIESTAGIMAGASGAMAAAAIAFYRDGAVERELRAVVGLAHAGVQSFPVLRVAGTLGGWLPLQRAIMAGRRPRRLAESGARVTPAELAGLKTICGIAGAAILLLFPSPLRLAFPIAALIGYLTPDALIHRAARRRRRLMEASVGEFVDLLAAASVAGLAAPLALRRAAAALEGPLGDELRTLVRGVDHGARWQVELDSLAERLDLTDLRRVAAAMRRTERLGASLSTAVRELATDVREARRTRATERARTAPVKMLFPLVFLILPAFLLLTVVPVLLSTLGSLQ